MRIECPICEYQFDMDTKPDMSGPITCSSCSKSFTFSPELVVQPTQKIATDAVIKPTLATAKIIPDAPKAPSIRSDRAQPRFDKTIYRRKNKKLKQGLLVGLLGLCILVLAGLIAFSGSIREAITGRTETADLKETKQIQSAPLVEKEEEEALGVDDSQNLDHPIPPLALRANGSETDLLEPIDKSVPPPETEPTIEYVQPKLHFMKKKAIDDTWLKVQPHLVELTAETAFGSVHSTGILIDTRGWVLASYRAVQGATEISVASSRKSIREEPGKLTDLVRGVIAADPEHDLAILKVIPRFVISFKELAIVDEDRVVNRQHLIHCVPPTSQYEWPAAECRIEHRKKTSELEEDQQQHLAAIGYRDADLRWMLHRAQSPLNEGGALVNEMGELVGMTVQSFSRTSSNDLCLAVPSNYILELKQKASTTTTPLPLPELDGADSRRIADTGQANSARGMPSDPETSANDGLAVLPKESLRRTLSLNLNRAGRKCNQFSWWPSSDEQAEDVHLFVDHLVTARRVIMAEPDDEKDTPILREQVGHWWEQFSSGFQLPDGFSEEAKSKFNRRYENEMQNETAKFVAFCKVHYAAIESPPFHFDNEPMGETITFQLAGTNQLILAKADEDWPVLRPGTQCLVLGELIQGSILINNDDGSGEKSSLAKVHFLTDWDP